MVIYTLYSMFYYSKWEFVDKDDDYDIRQD